ncbi:MAG: aminoacyl-tRNA hydrolase [Treponema sp.]|jgi:PTH1 family peptidyl-tRNA hydrolase|nr:aminoacyl-tRNA hydrolase [Treponema sp.]
MIDLVAFLGNPGLEYSRSRHNAGRLLAERLPFFSLLSWQKKYKGRYAILDGNRLSAFHKPEAPVPDVPPRVHFLVPETYMNLSGEAIHAAASFFRIPPEHILLVHDELELPLGTASFKFSGGLGGHNGLRSMNACFGTAAFWRLRIGIGRPAHRDISGWVLSDFSAGEEPVMDQVLSAGAAALTEALLRGPEALLPEWNKKKIVLPEAVSKL